MPTECSPRATAPGSAPKPTGLWPTDPKQEAQMTIDWTRKSYTWGLLQGMWDADGL